MSLCFCCLFPGAISAAGDCILSLVLSLCLAASPVNLAQPGIFGVHQLGHSALVPTSSMPACLSFPDMIKITGALKD